MKRTKKQYLEEQIGKRVELRLWKKRRRERIQKLLACPVYGQAAKELLAFLKTANNSRALLAHIDNARWCDADRDTRLEVLGLIDATLMRRRVQTNLPPFDDALPWSDEPENLFLILRARLGDENSGDVQGDKTWKRESTKGVKHDRVQT